MCTLSYGVVPTRAGNSRTTSACRLVRTAWKHVYPTACAADSYNKLTVDSTCDVSRHTVSVRSVRTLGRETETLGCLWPWRRRGFISDICLSLSGVPRHRLSCRFTKKNVSPTPPHTNPHPLVTQSNHSLPTSSPVVQVARLWEETEALLASINVPITSLMWCSPDYKEACAHQSAGKWRGGRRACGRRASYPPPRRSRWHQHCFFFFFKKKHPLRELNTRDYRGGKAALRGLNWISLVGP